MIRVAMKNEIDKIVETANKAFVPVRYTDFNFKNRVAKIYASKYDYSDIHFVAVEDNQIVSVAGNLVNQIEDVKYSFIGTVSTLPEYQNKGYMTRVINTIDQWNKDNEIVFSMLTGERKRYQNFGFEKTSYRYCFDFIKKHSCIYQNNQISLLKTELEEALNLYDIYLKTQKVIVRNKDNFYEYICSYHTPYTIRYNNEIVGYLTVKHKDLFVTEIALLDLTLLPYALTKLFELYSIDVIKLLVNPLNKELVSNLSNICESCSMIEDLHFKVYNNIKFINFIYNFNSKNKKFLNCKEVYKIEDKIFSFEILDNHLIIEEVKGSYIKSFSQMEFIRFIMGITSYNDSNIFPLVFDMNELDLF